MVGGWGFYFLGFFVCGVFLGGKGRGRERMVQAAREGTVFFSCLEKNCPYLGDLVYYMISIKPESLYVQNYTQRLAFSFTTPPQSLLLQTLLQTLLQQSRDTDYAHPFQLRVPL